MTLGITVLGTAMVCLLATASFTGALLVLVCLFGEAPGEGTRTGQDIVERLRSTDRFGAGGVYPASVGPERSEDEAA